MPVEASAEGRDSQTGPGVRRGREEHVDIITAGRSSQQPQDDRAVVLALSNLSEALADSDSSQGFDTLLDFALSFTEADAAYLTLKELGGDRLSVVASRNLPAPSGPSSEPGGHSPCLGEGLSRAAMETTELLCIDDLSKDTRDALGSLFSAGFTSSLCAPVIVGETSVGALAVLSVARREFLVSHLEVLWELSKILSESLLARRSGWVISPAQSSAEADAHLRDLRFVNRLSNAVISASNLADLLNAALVHSMEAVGASIGSLMLYDPRTRELTIAASRGLSQKIRQKLGTRKLGEGLSGWVAEHKKPLLFSGGKNDPRSDPRFRLVGERGEISSALIVPLRTPLRLIGVLNLARKKSARPLEPRHAELMETVANQMAVAIERMRLNEELQKRSLQLSTLMEVGKTITSKLELGVVTEQIAAQARNLTRAEMAFLFYYDTINDRVRFASQHGCPEEGRDSFLDLAREMALAAARFNRYITADELAYHPQRKMVRTANADNWAALPFRHRGHRTAIAVIAPRNGERLGDDAGELLDQFGSMAAVAIQNARQFTRQQALARVIEDSMQPPSTVTVERLEIAHRLIPQHEIGGDYYDFIPLDASRTGVVIADVAGSSLRSAAYTAVAKHALRAYAREYGDPAEVLLRLNRLICVESDSEMFISMFYGLIDTESNTLTYAVAGHEPSLMYQRATGRISRLRAAGILLGVRPECEFASCRRPFDAGDILALYTDGLTEARVHGKPFGQDRLKRLLRENAGEPVQRICDSVISARMRFSENRTNDDMALVLIRRTL